MKTNQNKNLFISAFRDFEKLARGDDKLFVHIETIALLGSAATKEEIFGWSDLDILLIVDSDRFGNIVPLVIKSLKDIARKLFIKYGIQISIAPHTRNDLVNYVSFEYLMNYSFGRVVYTRGLNLQNFIKEILRNRKLNSNTKKRYCLYHLRHIRFNLIRKYISTNSYSSDAWTRETSRLLIDGALEASAWALNFFDIWPKTKKSILRYVDSEFGKRLDTQPLHLALKLRAKGTKNTKKDLSVFMRMGLKYLSDLLELIISEYNYPTPEEKMRQ
ncbi:MAG: hypothetical protein M1334_02210 [Patescibacteria group bacterium]|nr:hypothetical protein [Patescibacteria group bacterium]